MTLIKTRARGLKLDDTFAFTGTVSGAGTLLNVAQGTNNTRTGISANNDFSLFSFSYNQQKASSKIRIDVVLWGWAESSGSMNIEVGYDSTYYKGFINHVYIAGSYTKPAFGSIFITGASSTGNKTVDIKYTSENSANARPFVTFNPNATDDARLGQTTSYATVSEFDL